MTVHGFRHTHCSLLFELGATIKEVQERMGHTDIKTTMNIYAHLTDHKLEETANKFASFMQGKFFISYSKQKKPLSQEKRL